MNSLRYNGGVINGARVVAALALVVCTSTAQVSAAATYIYRANGAINASASVAARLDGYLFGNSSAFIGQAGFIGAGKHTQAAICVLDARATLIAYSVRGVFSAADLGGFASATFIPASTLAYAAITATSDVIGEATKTQPGKVALTTTATLFPSDIPVFRMVEADLLGSVDYRVESGVNGVQDAYGDTTAFSGVLIEDSGLVVKQVGALIPGVSYVTATATYVHKAAASSVGGASLDPRETVYKLPKGSVVAQASLEASALYVFQGQSNIANDVVILASPQQKHLGHCTTVGEVTVVGNPTRNVLGTVSLTGLVSCIWSPTCTQFGLGNSTGNVEVVGAPHSYHLWLGECSIKAAGGLYPIGYENLMAEVDPLRMFSRPTTTRVFYRSKTSRTFRK